MYACEDSESNPIPVSKPAKAICTDRHGTGTSVVIYEDGDIEHHDCGCGTQSDTVSFIDPSIFEPTPDDTEARIEAILRGDDDGEDWSLALLRPLEISQETAHQYGVEDIPF